MRLEHENNFANINAKANAGVTLGTIGTAISGVNALTGGALNDFFSGLTNRNCNHEAQYTRYDAAKDARIAELETEVKLRDSYTFTMSEIGKFREYMESRLDKHEAAINAQAVYNATLNSTIGCLSNQVAQLMSLTNFNVNGEKICPPYMPLYNSWTAPTTPTTTG